MKNIIKTAICLIVISSILLYSSVSHAASVNVSVGINSSIHPVILSSDHVDSTDGTFYNYYTLQIGFNPVVNTATDSYKNGYIYIGYVVDNYLPTGATYIGSNWSYDVISSPEIYSYGYQSQAFNFRTFYTCTYLNNFGLNSQIPQSTVYFTYTIRFANETWTNFNSLSPTFTVNTQYSSVYAEPNPSNMGMAAVIKNAISNALADGELNLIYDQLVLWKTTQDGYLADIELYLKDISLSIDDVEMWLSYINSAQATLQNKVDLIYVLEQTFPGYFNSMISLLQQIRDMNASDTAAESQMQNAEQQLSQAVNDMEVQKPNINNVVNAGDQYMDSNITGAQGDTFFWLHGTNIFVTILTMAVTIGILGFVIYGKSG